MQQLFLSWGKQNKKVVKDTVDYIEKFQYIKPPILKYWDYPFLPSSSSGQIILLIYASLLQNIDEIQLVECLKKWFTYWNKDLFQRQKHPFSETLKVLQKSFGYSSWILAKQAPSILRSIGDFVSQNSKIEEWIQRQEKIETAVNELSQHIFYMGKNSLIKPKTRYFIWLLLQSKVKNFVSWNHFSLPITQGLQRWAYFVGPLEKGLYPNHEFKNSYKIVDYFLTSILPHNTDYYYALSCFQKKNLNNQLICKIILNGCRNCPLASYCFFSKKI